MLPKSLIIGVNGFIGSNFFNALTLCYPDIIGTSKKGEVTLDLLEPNISFSLDGYSWALIAAGYATPQRCYADPNLCEKIDLKGVLTLSKQLLKEGVTPVMFSTTQVFDGSLPLYYPDSQTSPVNLYGKIHADREERLLHELHGDCLILRLCRVFAKEQGMICEIVNELKQKQEVFAATDQMLQIVSVEEVISCVFDLQRANERGIFQICPEDHVSRYKMSCFIAKELGLPPEGVKPIVMSDIDDIPRPKIAHLASCYKVQPWKTGVINVVDQYRKKAVEECHGSLSR